MDECVHCWTNHKRPRYSIHACYLGVHRNVLAHHGMVTARTTHIQFKSHSLVRHTITRAKQTEPTRHTIQHRLHALRSTSFSCVFSVNESSVDIRTPFYTGYSHRGERRYQADWSEHAFMKSWTWTLTPGMRKYKYRVYRPLHAHQSPPPYCTGCTRNTNVVSSKYLPPRKLHVCLNAGRDG